MAFNKKILMLGAAASICFLSSCSDGKLAWDQEEAKKQEETKKDEDPSAVPADQWQAANEALDASAVVELGDVFDGIYHCLSTPADSLLAKLRSEFVPGEAIKVRMTFDALRIRGSTMRLLFFALEAEAKSKNIDNSAEITKNLSLSISGNEAKDMAKMNLLFKNPEDSVEKIFQSKGGWPLVAYQNTVAEPGRDRHGDVDERTRKVSGLSIQLPKSYTEALVFERIIEGNRYNTQLNYNTKTFRDCIASRLGR